MGSLEGKNITAQWLAGEESGQGLVEYALILLTIAVMVSVSLGQIGPALAGDFDKAKKAFR